MLSAGSIVSGAFQVIRERPAAFAVWTGLYLAVLVVMMLVMRSWLASLTTGAASFGSLFVAMLPLYLLVFILMLVLFTAAQRAVLKGTRPDRFFYLRLGIDELRTFVLAILLIIFFLVFGTLLSLGFTVLFAMFAMAGGPVAATVLGLMTMLAVSLAMFWFQVRLSLAFPLTLMRRRIVIGEAWSLSRGRFWSLFWGYLALLLIYFLVAIVASGLTQGSYWLDVARGGFTGEAFEQAAAAQAARQAGPLDALAIVGLLVSAVAGVFGIAIFSGAMATAARALAVDTDQIAETFA